MDLHRRFAPVPTALGLGVLFGVGCGPSSLRCGLGTHEVAGECRANTDDAGPDGAADASTISDGDLADGSDPDTSLPAGVVQIGISPLDGVAIGQTASQPLALGVPTTFGVYGEYMDGSVRLLTGGVTFAALPAGDSLQLTPHDGVVVVTATRAGEAQLSATVMTPSGLPLTATQRVSVTAPHALALAAVAIQDGSWYGPYAAWTAGVDGILSNAWASHMVEPARAPVGGGVRVVTALEYSVAVPVGSGPDREVQAQIVLDPAAVSYRPTAGTMVAPGLLRGDAVGSSEIAVGYALPGAAPLSATARARFVAPSAAVGLLFPGVRALLPYVPPLRRIAGDVFARPEGSLSRASFTDGSLGTAPAHVDFAIASAGRVYPARLAVVHGTGTDEYYESLPWSAVRFEVLSGSDVFAVSADGTFTASSPGVGAWIAHAAGFDLPGLTTTPLAPGATVRVSPSPLQITLPSGLGDPPVCRTVDMFVTPTGAAERALTPLELLVTERFPVDGPGSMYIAEALGRATEFCARRVGTTPDMPSYQLRFLGAFTRLQVQLALPR